MRAWLQRDVERGAARRSSPASFERDNFGVLHAGLGVKATAHYCRHHSPARRPPRDWATGLRAMPRRRQAPSLRVMIVGRSFLEERLR